MRAAGRVVAVTLQAVSEAAVAGVTTRELDALAAETIASHGAESNFLGHGAEYGPPFPGVICTSLNDETIHGIPGERVLRDGDKITFGRVEAYYCASESGPPTVTIGGWSRTSS